MEELIEVGLTKNEAKIYLSLIDLGPSLAGVISRKTGIHRRSVYDAIERLIEKGLIGYITNNNRKYFQAVNPRKLLDLIKEKEELINKILPDLEKKYNFIKEKQETLFFRGKQGIKSIFEDQINEAKEILIFGASKGVSEVLKYYLPIYNKRRINKKIKIKIIYDIKSKSKHSKIPLSEIRYLPYKSYATTNIYANKVAIILWQENPLAILINDKKIAQSYREYFNLMWKTAKK